MADTKVVPVKKEELHKIAESGLQFENEFAYAKANVTLPAGWAFEECLKPAFWSQVAHKFHKGPGDARDRSGAELIIRTQDNAFYAKLYVRAVRERDLIVDCIGPDVDPKTGIACLPHYFGPKSVDTEHYKVRWNLGKLKHEVIRLSDNEVVYADVTPELAAEWIAKTTGVPVKAKAA